MTIAELLLALDDPDAIPAALDLPSLDDGDLADIVGIGPQLVQKDTAVAAIMLSAVSEEAQSRSLLGLGAEAAYLQARAVLQQGHPDDALVSIDRAAALWTADNNLLMAARTGLGRMNVLDDLGRHREAIAVGEALIQSLDEISPAVPDENTIWLRAAALENIGVGQGYLGQHAGALEAYERAEAVYRENGLDGEVARPMANRGVELVELGRLDEAVTVLRMAALDFDAQGENLFAAKCLAYEARAQMLLGNYVGSAAASDRAAEYLSGHDATTEYARTQLVRAETLTSMNLLDKALTLTDDLIGKFSSAGLEHDLAAAHLCRAVTLTKLRRFDAALADFTEAEKRYQAVGDAAMAAVAQLGQSQVVDAETAEAVTASALATLRISGRPADHAAAELRASQLATDPDTALEHLDAVATILSEHGLPHLHWKERAERGRRLHDRGELDGARRAYEQALAGLDEMRRTVDQDLQRLPFMGGRDQVHQQLAALLIETGDVEEAYRVSEQARARTLVERMRGESSRTAIDGANETLDNLYSELLHSAAVRSASVRRRARNLEVVTGVASAADAAIPTETIAATTVTYQLIDDEVMAFVSEGSDLRVVRGLTTINEINRLLARLDAQWRRFTDPGLAVRQHAHLLSAAVDVLQRLHLALLGPLDVIDHEALVVVPFGAITNVPFSALHDGTCHLVERLAVTIAPSRTAAEHAAGRIRTGTRRLVLGIVDENTPLVHEEVAAVSAIGPDAMVLIDDEATVSALWEHAADHDVIHVASHGIERPDNPLFGAIRFADRWLTAAEIAGSSLDGQLVVLSACSSGRQFAAGTGDELIGLPRAFLAAGASAVLVNLWQVQDADAYELMRQFHLDLESQSAVAALRSAQLTVMSTKPHPYRWAPSVVVGAPPHRREIS